MVSNMIVPLICPHCRQKSGVFVYRHTKMTDFPLFCKKCKTTTTITYPEPESRTTA
ncbi:MAG: conjugal transfer protein [Ruminococcus sp.]|nr:conjugal transfer protein [Ruminococcus sp.]